ncbi:MAG TPA: hypothetical protein VFS75_03660 [Candidatus Paceibacterota bacterium]|nr:hypothetical protein [Candidatus Paceibacterota bacterium]
MNRRRHTVAAYNGESRLFYAAALSCIIVFAGYVYFLSLSVVHVVMRKEVDGQIAAVNTQVSELETAYIARQQSVSRDVALAKGFVIADKKIFIDKGADTVAFSRN